jgi:hypothetical protein
MTGDWTVKLALLGRFGALRLSIQNNMLIMLAESRSLRRKLVRHPVDAGLCFLWFLGGDGPWRRSPVGKCPLRRGQAVTGKSFCPIGHTNIADGNRMPEGTAYDRTWYPCPSRAPMTAIPTAAVPMATTMPMVWPGPWQARLQDTRKPKVSKSVFSFCSFSFLKRSAKLAAVSCHLTGCGAGR